MTDAHTPDSTPDNTANQVPAALQTPDNTAAGQPVAHDRNHEQNEVAGASRGEFGRQSDQGVTQGGYGNELSRGTSTYAGAPVQPAATSGYEGKRAQTPAGLPSTENGSFGTEAVGAGLPAGSTLLAQRELDKGVEELGTPPGPPGPAGPSAELHGPEQRQPEGGHHHGHPPQPSVAATPRLEVVRHVPPGEQVGNLGQLL